MTVYVDPVAVERACGGDRLPLRRVERVAAVQRLTAAGVNATIIAARLGVAVRTVVRDRGRPRVEVSPFG